VPTLHSGARVAVRGMSGRRAKSMLLLRAAGAAVALAGMAMGGSFVDELFFKGKVSCDFRFFPDGHRVLAAEKHGRFRIYDTRTAIAAGDTQGDVWMDIREHPLSIESEKERGVLGFAFDPGFETGSPYVYVVQNRCVHAQV
jgi:hypothetical protein